MKSAIARFLSKPLIPSLFLLFSALTTTLFISVEIKKNLDQKIYEEADILNLEISMTLQARLLAYAQYLRNCAGYIAISDTVTRLEWKNFIAYTKVDSTLSAFQGIGYSLIVAPDQMGMHLNKIRREGFPAYLIWPDTKRNYYTSVIFVEPFNEKNLRVFGYDAFSEPRRRVAMEASRDRYQPILTNKIILKQEDGDNFQSGTIMFYPVYRQGESLESIPERRRAIKGWVFCSLRIGDLMQDVLKIKPLPAQRPIHLQVIDANIPEPDTILYDDIHSYRLLNRLPDEYTAITGVNFNGKKWNLHLSLNIRSNLLSYRRVIHVLIIGSTISILVSLMLYLLLQIHTDKKKIESLNRELQEHLNNKDMFISILAHDLKNPFNALLGFSGLLKDDLDHQSPEEIREFTQIIHSKAHYLHSLIDNLLLWIKSTSRRINPSRTDFLLSELFEDVVGETELMGIKKHITVSCMIAPNLRVSADRSLALIILRNLLTNAIKFTPQGGSVHVRGTIENHEAIVSISDSGVGIPPEKRDKLFILNRSESSAGTDGEQGTGLGLMICRELAELNGGRVWLSDSVPGQGSEFCFSIPLSKSDRS